MNIKDVELGFVSGNIMNDLISVKKEERKSKKVSQKAKQIIKRSIDIIGGIVGVLILIPLTIVVAIVNLVSREKGPIFYSQERIGKNGKLFKMYKFRTMVVDSEERLKVLLTTNEDARAEWEEYRKLKNDPRVTKIGNFLRKTSLDEFPQFVNVLKNDMSLVGPRPYLPREREDMGDTYEIVINSKPGITGLWQVSGRSEVTFEERLDIDIEYDQNKDLGYDLEILWKTVLNVVKKEGAV